MDATARSLRLFGIYFPLSRMLFHAPVFFLFLSARFGIDDVLRLSALYYPSVVVLEVPSGYPSDRIGRVWTLRPSSIAKIAAAISARRSAWRSAALGGGGARRGGGARPRPDDASRT